MLLHAQQTEKEDAGDLVSIFQACVVFSRARVEATLSADTLFCVYECKGFDVFK